jgi:hypothetical protein
VRGLLGIPANCNVRVDRANPAGELGHRSGRAAVGTIGITRKMLLG